MPEGGPKRKRSKGPTKKELESDLKDLKRELEQKEERVEELVNRLSYLQADLENIRKSHERERRETLRYATQGFIQEILPILDEFDLALKSMKDMDDDFGSGIRMIYAHILKALQSEGLEEIPAEGRDFDPYVHEAVAYVEKGERPGAIVEVLQKGYRMRDRILRPSQVVVCRKEGEQGG